MANKKKKKAKKSKRKVKKKIKTDLEWSPKVNFDDGLRDTINWYIDNKIMGDIKEKINKKLLK